MDRNGRPWRRLRDRIVRRDGGICHLCGQPGADTADHLTPVSLGGNYSPANLAAAHQRCNRLRSNGTVDAARQRLAQSTSSAWDW